MPRGDIRLEIQPANRGLRTDLPTHLVPQGYLINGQNVICRDGKILSRPGYSPLVATGPGINQIMGLVHYLDATQTNRLLAGTTTDLFTFSGSAWSEITGTDLTGTTSNQVRFAVFPFTSTVTVIAVNDKDVPQAYSGSGNFAALGGSPPVAKCCTVAFQRAILGNTTVGGTRHPSELWISNFQDPTTWQSVNVANLTDTKDTIIEIQALNSQVFAIYKDKSQWVGVGAANIFPFVFELKSQEPGPTSPASVVVAEDVHYYLGQDGDIYRFDGNSATSIGGQVKRSIQSNLDWTNQAQVHGFYDAINREIWWFWPIAGNTTSTGGITYRLPYSDIPGAFSPLHVFGGIISASAAWTQFSGVQWNQLTGTWLGLGSTYPTWESFSEVGRPGDVVGTSLSQVHTFGQTAGDNGNMFSAQWDVPFQDAAGAGENVRIDVIESFFKQTATSQTVNIVLVTSDTLSDMGTSQPAQSVDTSTGTKLRALYNDVVGRYISIRHVIPATNGLDEYRGGVIYVYRRGEA